MAAFISIEDHYAPQAFGSMSEDGVDQFPDTVRNQLGSLGNDRIEAMDASNIAVQVVSPVPVDLGLDAFRVANDDIAQAVVGSNGRLKGFAGLPMRYPDDAARELKRCIKEHGFVGALVGSHASEVFYDGPAYHDFWKSVEDLNVPIYLHPIGPAAHNVEKWNGIPERPRPAIERYAWGWHIDTAEAFLRMWTNGIFDLAPSLKVILGHDGELLPYMLARSHRVFDKTWNEGNPKRDLLEVWKTNVWVTTSGMWSLAPFACLLQTTSADRIMYSLDYPFEKGEEGVQFMAELKESKMLSEEEYAGVAYKNAELLLAIHKP